MKAKTNMTTDKRRSADLSPSHTLTRQFKVRVRPEILDAYSKAVQIAGTTKTRPVEDFMERFAKEQGVPIQRSKQQPKPKSRSTLDR
jgi:hypothetical protein